MRQIQTTLLIQSQGGHHQGEVTFLFAEASPRMGHPAGFMNELGFKPLRNASVEAWGIIDRSELFVEVLSFAMSGGRARDFLPRQLGPSGDRLGLRRGPSPWYRDFAQYALETDVIIEHSPPEAVGFGELLKGASWVSVGTLTGVTAAGGNPLLMLIEVPLGIILVGTAVGIATGIQKGLARRIERAIDRTGFPHE